MKRIKYTVVALLLVAMLMATSGCTVIQSQDMNSVKGTYKLTTYTYTPEYTVGDDVPDTCDYVNGDEYVYEDYLVVTGTSMGYYVHKSVADDAYVREVALSYEYDEEDDSMVTYVKYNDSLTASVDSDVNSLGVTKDSLNYTKPSLTLPKLFSDDTVCTSSVKVRWEKVDDATDLTYVREIFPNLLTYSYDGFAVRGIYEFISYTNESTGEFVDDNYQYYFLVVDTADGLGRVTEYSAQRDNPNQREEESFSLVRTADDWSSMSVEDETWMVDPFTRGIYYTGKDGLKRTYARVSYKIDDATLESLIQLRLPMVVE